MEIEITYSEQPISQPVSWGLWELVNGYGLVWKEKGIDCHLYIKHRTYWDGASTPRILTPIMPKRGINDAATLVHDVLFESRGYPYITYDYYEENKKVKRIFTLDEVNTLFYKLLSYHGYPIIRGGVGVLAVEVASPYLWKDHKRKIHKKIKEYLKKCEHY